MFVLALDCSTALGSIALSRGADPAAVWQAEFTTGRGQGGKLFKALAEAMQTIRAANGRLERIVVGLGPGSYSGVRQAIAAATGLAAATGARLVGAVSAAALDVETGRYQAVGDARRGTFYYSAVENGRCVAGPELLETGDALRVRLTDRDGWPVFAVESLPPGIAANASVALPTAKRLLTVPVATHIFRLLEPIYLRPVAFTLPKAKLEKIKSASSPPSP